MSGGILLILLSFGPPGADAVPGALLATRRPLPGKPAEPAADSGR
jgi:hypothetical protein